MVLCKRVERQNGHKFGIYRGRLTRLVLRNKSWACYPVVRRDGRVVQAVTKAREKLKKDKSRAISTSQYAGGASNTPFP